MKNLYRPKPTDADEVTVFVASGKLVIGYPGGTARIAFADLGLGPVGHMKGIEELADYRGRCLADERKRTASLQAALERERYRADELQAALDAAQEEDVKRIVIKAQVEISGKCFGFVEQDEGEDYEPGEIRESTRMMNLATSVFVGYLEERHAWCAGGVQTEGLQFYVYSFRSTDFGLRAIVWGALDAALAAVEPSGAGFRDVAIAEVEEDAEDAE